MAESRENDRRVPSRRATIVDVAHHAGVSIASASKVVRGAYGASEAMQARVLASVAALDYRPHRLAQGLRGPTKTIGVLLPDIENPFFDLLIDGASRVFASSGHELFFVLGGRSEYRHLAATELLIDHRMDGLMLVSPRGTPQRLEQFGLQVPTVVVGRHGPATEYDTVSGDDVEGSRLIVEHLVALGHHEIAFLANDSGDDASLPETLRLAGYREAMSEAGLDKAIDIVPTPWTSRGGRAAAQGLLGRARLPSAVHAGADVVALGLLTEFWDRGVEVPRDVSVSGYDNSPFAGLRPVGLTSVDQSGRRMGQIAAALLVERIEGRTEPRHEVLAPHLEVRSTTARLARR